MNFFQQISLILICFVVSFIVLRMFLYGVKRFVLNNSAYKKRKKEETFWEWLSYKRFRNDIPKILIFLYVAVMAIDILALLLCFALYIFQIQNQLGEIIAKCIFYFTAIWMLIIAILFWTRGKQTPYGRWITKRKNKNNKYK